jgi:hypothetical protein
MPPVGHVLIEQNNEDVAMVGHEKMRHLVQIPNT